MKHIKLKSFGLALLLSISACKKDFLQQNDPNSVAVTNYFKTENDVLLAVNGCYSALRSGNTIGEGSDLWTDQRSDDTGTNDSQSNSGEPFQFNNFAIVPGNSYLYSHWAAM